MTTRFTPPQLNRRTYPTRTNTNNRENGFVFSDDIKHWQTSKVKLSEAKRKKK